MKQITAVVKMLAVLAILFGMACPAQPSNLNAIELDLRDHKSAHLFEIVNADHAFRRQIIEHAVFELCTERDDRVMVTYLMDVPRHLQMNLDDSRKRGRFLQNDEHYVVQTYLNHRKVMSGQGPYSNYDELMSYYKEKMQECMARSYQPVAVLALKEYTYLPPASIEVSFVVQQNLGTKLLDTLYLVPLLIIDPLPSYTIADPAYSHKNVAVQSLSLVSSDKSFDGSGYQLSAMVDASSLSKGEEIKLSFAVAIPAISWEGQWKVMFILENHRQKTQFGAWIKLLED